MDFGFFIKQLNGLPCQKDESNNSFNLFISQREIVDILYTTKKSAIIINKDRQDGISTVMNIYLLYKAIKNQINVCYTYNSFYEVSEFLIFVEKNRYVFGNDILNKKNNELTKITFSNGSTIIFVKYSETSLRGMRFNIVYLSEFCYSKMRNNQILIDSFIATSHAQNSKLIITTQDFRTKNLIIDNDSNLVEEIFGHKFNGTRKVLTEKLSFVKHSYIF